MAWIEIQESNGLYSINDDTMQVRNNKTGYIRKKGTGSISLSLGGKKKRGYTPQRLLYSALHGVPIDKIPRDIVFVVENDKIAMYSIKDLARKNVKKGNSKQKLREGGYETIKIFVDAMIECKKNGCYGRIYEILYNYRDALINYTTQGKAILTKDEACDVVDIVIEQTFKDIKSGSVVIFPFGYMIKSIKSLKSKMKRLMRISREEFKCKEYF